jgi:hypothetical protein
LGVAADMSQMPDFAVIAYSRSGFDFGGGMNENHDCSS